MYKLNRFTTIPFLIDMLSRETLTLLNPDFWEDYNDRVTVKAYQTETKSESIYALCLTDRNETIHHWNAFSNGTSGCCIEFNPEKLFAILNKDKNIVHDKVEYINIRDIKSSNRSKLPYLKRKPFNPENEYRIIATSSKAQAPTYDVKIDLGIIRKITLSSKLPESVFESLMDVIQNINPNFKGQISHSTLFKNSRWINYFSALADVNKNP